MQTKRLLYLLFCYVLGSINSALLLTYIFKRVDIRTLGDGNAGATNVFQNVNKFLGAIVFLVDFIKGMIPIYVGNLLLFHAGVIVIGGALTILGHDFPLFFGFKGGTGITSILGGVFYINNQIGIQICVIFVVAFTLFSFFKKHFFNFSYLEESEVIGFVLAIFLILKNGSILLKEYFFLSLSIIVFKHRDKVVEIFSGVKSADR